MKIRKSIFIGLCVASLGGISVPMMANADHGIYLSVPPPPIRIEAVPAPRHGHHWSPGFWDARHNRHAWQRGHWERERSGYYYAEPTWTQRDNRWELQRGRWNKGDRDGDGVRNSRDRAPDNPNRH